ncbi:hemin uptake protein HemP [Pseudooceanicola sp.]|uniref:hemin uptake protein HemP n=1 Tax=Pseudooceanicola sp. TaxID=1914328 RepID=UPI003517ECBF
MDGMNDDDRPDTTPARDAAEGMPTYDARALTGGGALAGIVLDGQLYMLRITKAGKLILTK